MKIRLGIERERWNKVREEKARLRKPYEDRLQISKLLADMNERAIIYTKEQLNTNITKKQWESIAKDVGKVIPKHLILLMLILPRFQTLAKNKLATRFLTAFLIDITGVLNNHGYGSLEAEKDATYSQYLKQVRDYEIGLPANICSAIEGNILTSKMFSTLQVFEPSQPAFRKLDINPAYVNKVQYLLPTIQIMSGKSVGNIHESIENWLTGA